jgi:hypothetical protein
MWMLVPFATPVAAWTAASFVLTPIRIGSPIVHLPDGGRRRCAYEAYLAGPSAGADRGDAPGDLFRDLLRPGVGSTPPAHLVALAVPLLLLPAARILPALAALGLLTAYLAAIVCYEWLGGGEQDPTAETTDV